MLVINKLHCSRMTDDLNESLSQALLAVQQLRASVNGTLTHLMTGNQAKKEQTESDSNKEFLTELDQKLQTVNRHYRLVFCL